MTKSVQFKSAFHFVDYKLDLFSISFWLKLIDFDQVMIKISKKMTLKSQLKDQKIQLKDQKSQLKDQKSEYILTFWSFFISFDRF